MSTSDEMQYLYFHGFASGTRSRKAVFLQSQFTQKDLTLHLPDLNLGNFTEITTTAQLEHIQSNYTGMPLTVIGSSLGGFLAVQLAAINPLVERLILLAPAFQFPDGLKKRLGEAAIAKWQKDGALEYYHYSENRSLPLKYNFFLDAQKYSENALTRELPVLIIHGINDEVIPAKFSEDFARLHRSVTLELVNSDHSLSNVLDLIWQKTQIFLGI